MIAVSRIANVGRTVMPYASWAFYVLQLGYVGYNLYNYYQDYLEQVERDQRSNTQRGLDETIELVVARRRRRIDRQLQSEQQQASAIQQQPPQPQPQPQQPNRVPDQEDQASSHSAPSDPAIVHIDHHDDESNTNNTSMQAADGHRRSLEDQENSAQLAEQIDRDRRSQLQQHRVEVDPSGIETVYIEDDDDEVLSDDASLSLESTDSNRAIIKDMYSECFICARTLNDPNKQVATLPFCMHPFHKSCLDGVLKWHRKCPVCDFDIFSPI